MDTDNGGVLDRPQLHRLSGPADLLQAVPYLLGFHPRASLVLIGLRAARLVVTARVDLAEAPAMLAHTVAAMGRGGAREFVLAVFDDEAGTPGWSDGEIRAAPLPWTELALAASELVEGGGGELVDVLLVAGGRWWSYLCGDGTCCPPAGSPLPAAPSAFAAAATCAGVVVLPDRDELVRQLEPRPDRDRLAGALAAAEVDSVATAARGETERQARAVKRAMFAAARAAHTPRWSGPGDDDAVRFGSALRSIAVRDAVWLAVDEERIDGRELWRELGRRLPPPYDAAPLFLFGWRSWRVGDGALARIAAERAIESDPGYSAADLLLAALSQGMSPRQVPRLRSPRRG